MAYEGIHGKLINISGKLYFGRVVILSGRIILSSGEPAVPPGRADLLPLYVILLRVDAP
jgi:hypothetical protein